MIGPLDFPWSRPVCTTGAALEDVTAGFGDVTAGFADVTAGFADVTAGFATDSGDFADDSPAREAGAFKQSTITTSKKIDKTRHALSQREEAKIIRRKSLAAKALNNEGNF